MKKIGIIGTRRRNNASAQKVIEDKFFELYEDGDWIVSGGCSKGGDEFAHQIAKKNGIPILIFYPDYKRFSRGAPMARNAFVAKHSDVIVACVIRPEEGLAEVVKREKGGTEDTLKKFIKLYYCDHPEREVHLV